MSLLTHVAHALKMARENPEKEQLLVVNLSGRGDKDIFTVHAILEEKGADLMNRYEKMFDAPKREKPRRICTVRNGLRSKRRAVLQDHGNPS